MIEHLNGHNLAVSFHDAGTKDVVIFCHGFRGSSIGPNRFFVRAARKLAAEHISSLRFDQFGSGNSEGDFRESSFNDWVSTTRIIVRKYLDDGYRVALFGQSMGGSTVLAVGAETLHLTAIVAWVPDAGIDTFTYPESGIIEESGQVVQASYWQEAHDARIADAFTRVKAPTYVVQCTADEYVDEANRRALAERAAPHQRIDTFEGYRHSSWSYKESEDIIDRSVAFLARSFQHPTAN